MPQTIGDKSGYALTNLEMRPLAAWVVAVSLGAVSPFAAATPAEGSADSASGTADTVGLEEVVVTAQKRSENAQDVPITITAISAQDLAAAGVTSAMGLTNVVPGLTVTSNAGTFQPRLRGIGTTFFGPGIENPVALYVDDVYYGSQLLAPTDFSDVTQVSVLYGPQGTLFGRNTTGGVIQLATLDPTSKTSGQVSTELDNYWTSRTFGYLTGGIAPDLAANFAVKYTTQGQGWGRNLTTGDYTHKINSDVALRTKWLWTPSETTAVKLSFDYADYTNSMGANESQYPAPGWTGFFPGLNVTSFSRNPYDSTNWLDNRNQLTHWGTMVRVEQELGFARLVSISAYSSYHGLNFEDTIGSPVALSGTDPYSYTGHQFTQELQLISRKSERFNWVAGAFYYGATDKVDPLQQPFNGLLAQIFYGAMNSAISVDNVDLTSHSPAVFAQGTLNLGAHTEFTGGVRRTHETRRITGTNQIYLDGSTTPDPIYSATFGPANGGDFSDSHTTYRAALNHEFSADTMAYVSYNTGFKSGGFNAITGVPQPPYKAETVNAYEVGLKNELFDHTVRVNLAGFYNKYDNLQLLLLEGCCLNVVNATNATIYGADLDGEWKPSRDFSIRGGVEWLHARFNSFPNLPYSVAVPGAGISTYPGVPPLPERDGDGLALPYSPDWTADLVASYTLHAGADRVVLTANDHFSGRYYFEPDNFISQGGYNLVNASVTWFLANDQLSIALLGRNLTNKIVPTTVAAFAPGSWLADNENPPRMYGVAVHYWFGQ